MRQYKGHRLCHRRILHGLCRRALRASGALYQPGYLHQQAVVMFLTMLLFGGSASVSGP